MPFGSRKILRWTGAVLFSIFAIASGCAGGGSDGSSGRAPVGPAIVEVSPAVAPLAGGIQVEVDTARFSTSFLMGLPTVLFGGQPGTSLTVLSPTRVRSLLPASPAAGLVDVEVISQDGSESAVLSDGFSYIVAPIVSALSPDMGDPSGGELVTVIGDNFDTTGPVTVAFGLANATGVTVIDSMRLDCITPPGSLGPVTVTVTNPDLQQGALMDAFTYACGGPAVIQREDCVFDLINQERGVVGKPDLTHDPAIRLVARAHSEDMRDRNFFDHRNPDGDDPDDRLLAAGISFGAWAEIIQFNLSADPAQAAFDWWMNSALHRGLMLDESNVGFTLTGIGASTDGAGTWWFTAMFVRP
ncbi:MAG: IPT/TIG domain-containing protein [Planctomycetota bacterium]|nr:IPT/TIG domain-containing protein [Planctomycetota bacterium]